MSAPAPEVATPRLMAFTAGVFFTAGGVASLLVTLESPSVSARSVTPGTVVLLVLSLTALAGGLALLRWGRHLPPVAFHGVVASATLMLATGVVVVGDDASALAVAGLFVFCAVDVLFFFAGAGAAAQVTLLVAAAAGSLLVRGVEPGVAAAVVLVQAAIALVTGRLVKRAGDGSRDTLTGLPNRRGFDDRLDTAVAHAHRTGSPLAVVLVDLDHFKAVNDRGGRGAGDVLLVRTAERLAAALPPGVVLTRCGGDEFALLAPGLGQDAAASLCEQLHAAVGATGLSVGVAQLVEGEDGGSVVRRADAALFAAKDAGRGVTRVADARDTALARDLALAVASDAIDVALQPLVVPGSGELVGVEALARWDHPERGRVSPAEFVPLAESSGLVSAFGATVLRRACRDAVTLRAALGRDLLLTVNASAEELVRPGYVDGVAAALAETGWGAAHLVVEVTESSIEAASGAARATLAQLRELGVAVAIDDFGTGFSAFSQLDALPADYLKLDAAFTAETTTSPRRTAMLRALLDLCDDLDLTVIAEGVETPEQADLLSALGCPLAQGYHFARPAAVADLVRTLTAATTAPRTPASH